MKFAYSSNAYRRWSLNEAIGRIAGLGYAGFELMADEPHAWPAGLSPRRIDSIGALVRSSGLSISNINAFMMNAVQDFWHPSWIEPDEEFRRLRIDHTKASLRLAARLGARTISTEPGGPLPPGMPRDAAMDVFVAGLRDALGTAEEVGVMLLVEPEPGLLIETAVEFEELADRIESPAFGLNFDIGHFFCVADPLPQTVRRLHRWTWHYHFEDIAASCVHEHLVPGAGAIDFSEVLAAIRSTGYRDWITVELYPYLDDPDAAGRQALEYLRALMPS